MQKTCCPFSAIAYDQAHEQCNAMVKGNGGAIGLASSPGAMRRWVTAGPQMARLLKSFEHSMTSKCADGMDHHKQSPAPQKAFKINVQALVVSFEEAGNPFEDDGGCLFALDFKAIVDAAAMTAVSSIITSGIQQYNNFVEERLEKRTKPIKMSLRQRKAQKSSLTILRHSCSLFSRLYIACQTRSKRGTGRFFSGKKTSHHQRH